MGNGYLNRFLEEKGSRYAVTRGRGRRRIVGASHRKCRRPEGLQWGGREGRARCDVGPGDRAGAGEEEGAVSIRRAGTEKVVLSALLESG